MNRLSFKHLLAFALIASSVVAATGQARIPTEITSSTIREQIQYVEDHTRIYENYRAIREDIYQKVNRNFLDTLKAEKTRIAELNNLTADLVSQTDSLGVLLEETRARLEEVTATKNSITVLGIEVRKKVYNTIMWTLLGGLVFLLVLGFLIFKRNVVVLIRTEKDLAELKEEFNAYRQSSRLAREKVEMDLFRANQKLKGRL
jgi:hypothetical protein